VFLSTNEIDHGCSHQLRAMASAVGVSVCMVLKICHLPFVSGEPRDACDMRSLLGGHCVPDGVAIRPAAQN